MDFSFLSSGVYFVVCGDCCWIRLFWAVMNLSERIVDVLGPRFVPAIAPAAGELCLPWLEGATFYLPILPINSSVVKTKLFVDGVVSPNSVMRRLFELLPLSIKSFTKF